MSTYLNENYVDIVENKLAAIALMTNFYAKIKSIKFLPRKATQYSLVSVVLFK